MRAAPKKTEERKILQELVPLNALSEERFQELASKIVIEEVKAGRYLFRKGDRDNQSIYLLDGKINLIDGFRKVAGEVESGTDISRYPIASQQPRPFSARVVKKSIIARIDSGLVDVFLTWDQSSTAEVVEIGVDDNNDWMTRLLQSEAFRQLPPAKLQGLLMKMRPISVHRGDVVIEEGSEGDYFYNIHEGRCEVTRLDQSTGKVQRLAELVDGDSFGEDALVSNRPRNATVTMLTDGQLMRLAKQDFDDLLKKELVRHVGLEQAEALVMDGAVWLDVRTADEYQQGAFEDSVNIPLASLRGELPELVFNAKYIVCCDTGRRSDSAGFLLSHKGFDVYVLEGGISGNGLPSDGIEDAMTDPVLQPVDDATHESVAVLQPAPVLHEVHTDQPVQYAQLQAENDNLQAQYDALLQDQQARDREKADLEDMLEQLRGELGESTEKMSDLYARVSALDEEKHLLIEQFGNQQAEQLDQTQTVQLELEQERHRSQSLQRQVEALSGEHALLSGQIETGQQEIRAQLASMYQELDDARQQHAVLLSSLAESRSGSEQLEQKNRELEAAMATLQAAGLNSGEALASHEQMVVQLQSANADLGRQLELARTELADLDSVYKDVSTGSEQMLAELRQQNAELQMRVSELQDQLASLSTGSNQASGTIAELQEEINNLHSTVRELNARDRHQSEEIENLLAGNKAAAEAYTREQAVWIQEKERLQAQHATATDHAARLGDELEQEKQKLEQARAEVEQQHQQQVERYNATLESQEARFADLQQAVTVAREELELAGLEQTKLQGQLDEALAGKRGSEEQVEILQAELRRIAEVSEQQVAGLEQQLADGDRQLAEVRLQIEAREAQLASMHVEIGQHEVARTVQQQELDLVRAQLADLQLVQETHGNEVRALENDIQETARKAHEDLKRKNDNEKELQGQLERLRKKLEQVTADYQKDRKQAQESIDHLREELHIERQARDDERAQMAARQRELKEQLSSIASEHEVNVSNHTGVLEQALDKVRAEERSRLQSVLDAQAASELMIDKLNSELRQARTELAEYHRQEKDRREVDIRLIEEQNQQAEAAISQLHTQLKQLTEERDDALEQQLQLREKMDALRGEVEVARGLMNQAGVTRIEDPVQLRKQLDETRKDVEVAVRLRAEAEAARDRAQAQLESLKGSSHGAAAVLPQSRTPVQSATVLANTANVPSRPATVAPVLQPLRAEVRPAMKRWLIPVVALLLVASGAGYLWVQYGSDLLQQHAATGMSVTQGAAESTARPGLPAESSAQQQANTVITPAPVAPAAVQVQPGPVAADNPPASVQPQAIQVIVPAPSPVLGKSTDVLKSGGQGPELVELAAAVYQMGSQGNSINAEEVPRHQVTLHPFAISRYEVTFADYDRYARATGQRLPYDETWGRGPQPVINVSWKDANGYVRWLSAQTGKTYRLPTEAEWEYAARAGNVGNYWWTEVYETIPANCFNCGSSWDGARTAPVGQFAANSLGIYDMAGNVQEWTADCYHPNYNGAPADGAIWEGVDCSQRVVRGGAYSSPLDSLRSAKRAQLAEDTRLDNLGFRVVRVD